MPNQLGEDGEAVLSCAMAPAGAHPRNAFKTWLVCCAAIGFYLALLGVQIRDVFASNHGTFVYSLDDAYIHLAIARNLVLYGSWGPTPHVFAGASSSPGWTVLLALAFRIFGNHLLLPLILNALFAILLIVFVTRTFLQWIEAPSNIAVFCSLAAMILLTPMPGLTLVGMETLLQALLATGLGVLSAEMLEPGSERVRSRGRYAAWLITAFAAGAVRYETVFFVIAFAVYALFRRKFGLAIMLGAASALSPALYGLYALRHGNYALPYSVIVKAHEAHTGHSAISAVLSNLIGSPVAPILLIAAVVFLLRFPARRLNGKTQTLLLLFLGTCFLHLLVGPTGWLMRYEAYLFSFGVVAAGLAIADDLQMHARALPGQPQWKRLLIPNLALLVALIPTFRDLLARAHHGYTMPVLSAHDRYVEHLSPALFVGKFYRNRAVAANDIGFISYYGQSTVLDPLGLGSVEPVNLLKAGKEFTPADMEAWASRSGAAIAILQTDYPVIHDLVPPNWLLVESWCYPRNVVFRDHTISFFATTTENAEQLRTNLAIFQPLSPEVVRTSYTDGSLRTMERPLTESAPCEAPPEPSK